MKKCIQFSLSISLFCFLPVIGGMHEEVHTPPLVVTLFRCIQNGEIQAVANMLHDYPDLVHQTAIAPLTLGENSDARDKLTPLSWAVICNRQKIVETIFAHKPDPNILDSFDLPALYYALVQHNDPMVQCLLVHGALPTVYCFWSVIFEQEDIERFKKLAAYNNFHINDKDGVLLRTVIGIEKMRSTCDLTKAVLEKGADPHLHPKKRGWPLSELIYFYTTEGRPINHPLIHLLCSQPNACNQWDENDLYTICFHNKADEPGVPFLMQELLDSCKHYPKCHLNKSCKGGKRSCLHLCLCKPTVNVAMAKKLLDGGADPNCLNETFYDGPQCDRAPRLRAIGHPIPFGGLKNELKRMSPWGILLYYHPDDQQGIECAAHILATHPNADKIALRNNDTFTVEQLANMWSPVIYELIEKRRRLGLDITQLHSLAIRAFYEKDKESNAFIMPRHGLSQDIVKHIFSYLPKNAKEEWLAQPLPLPLSERPNKPLLSYSCRCCLQ